jgi:hypothetical protein
MAFLGFPLIEWKCAVYSSLLAIFINLVISYIILYFATKEEVNPGNKPHKLSFKSQLIHSLVSFIKIPSANSIIIFIISVTAVLISHKVWDC